MKALEILKSELNIETKGTFCNETVVNNLQEAINELEELENRSCNNCKHWELGWCFKLGSSLDIGGCGDYWELKC